MIIYGYDRVDLDGELNIWPEPGRIAAENPPAVECSA